MPAAIELSSDGEGGATTGGSAAGGSHGNGGSSENARERRAAASDTPCGFYAPESQWVTPRPPHWGSGR